MEEQERPRRVNKARLAEDTSGTASTPQRANKARLTDESKSKRYRPIQKPQAESSPQDFVSLIFYASAVVIALSVYAQFFPVPTGLESFLTYGMPVAIIALIITASIRADSNDKAAKKARFTYCKSLEDLKANPSDADLREKTLGLGRIYYSLLGGNNIVTVFDELAIKNDIDAACAGSVQVQNQPASPDTSIEQRLAKLKMLFDAGHINEEEYRNRRRKIIDGV